MKTSGRDDEMQIDLPIQRSEHAQRAVSVVATRRANPRRDFALKHQDHFEIMRELSHSRRKIAAATLNGRLPIHP